MSNEHDSSYKFLFSNPEMVRDLILGFVPDDWLHSLDYTTLEKVDGHYITEDLQGRADDIVWRVKVGGEWIYLYLLIEFQSSVDKYMALRMMVYVGLLYQDLIKSGSILADGRLPPVLPIVLYNGEKSWTAAADIFDLIPPVPGLVEQFKPHLKYLLIDENAYTESDLASLKNLVAAVFRIERPVSREAITNLITSLHEWLADRPDLRRMFAVWIRATLMRKTDYHAAIPEVNDLQELNIMLYERIESWAHEAHAKGMLAGMQQGRQEGRQEGMQQGEGVLLHRQLARRFGASPEAINAKLSHATVEQIELWGDRVLDAKTLDEVFRTH
ncbi:MAG: Rpn family recombination-promoting nuclease/putative transposase [Rhodocyclaceae bacterium]|nr:Rpn family recombination-promoting nuclease/putative transposase [Rhodocyclaceae bacterium]